MVIADLPFRERPIRELLHFDDARIDVDRAYAGYGWARVPRIWIGEKSGPRRSGADSLRPAGPTDELVAIDDALVLVLHSSDVGEELADDVELEFELPGAEPVTVLASTFLEIWLPRLSHASAIVLAMCNPHAATLKVPAGFTSPIYYATGDVESWLDEVEDDRLELLADGSWARLAP